MRPCISEATTLSSTFAEDVNGYADGGCHALEVWLTKLESHLEKHSVADTRKLLEDRQMTLAAAAYQGGLLLSQGEQRQAHYDHFKRRLDLCQSFGIPILLIAADFVDQVDAMGLERAVVSLTQAAQLGLRLRRSARPGVSRFRLVLRQPRYGRGPGRSVRRAERRRQPRRFPLLHRPK